MKSYFAVLKFMEKLKMFFLRLKYIVSTNLNLKENHYTKYDLKIAKTIIERKIALTIRMIYLLLVILFVLFLLLVLIYLKKIS